MDNKNSTTAHPTRRLLLSLLIALLPLFYACTDSADPEKFTVTFNANGGSAVKSQKVEKDKKAAKPTDPNRESYTFGGWYANEDLTTVFAFDGAITRDTTLYAGWEANRYKVVFNTNEGTAVPEQTIAYGEKATKPNDPTREGHIFKGWYGEEELTTVFDFGGAITADTTLYALWEELLIPDANFRNELKTLIPDAFEGEQLNPNHNSVTTLKSLSLSDKQIASLEGIRYFTALTTLYCNSNQLDSLDVSQNTALTELYCNFNKLTALDVSKNTALTYLNCFSNQLTKLEVSQNTALKRLICSANQLTALVVSQNTALTYLSCLSNQLTTLDVSQNTALTYLDCGSNQLTDLNVSQNTALTYLDCNSNKLTKLEVSQNTALTSLYCYSNKLDSLELSKNTDLTQLYCNDNKLTTLDVSQNTALTTLECYSNQLTDLDISGMRSLKDNKEYNLSINAGADSDSGKTNLLTTLKVHDNLKNADEIKLAKTNRGDEVKISVYTAAKGATDYTKTCADYNPNADGGGACLDP